MINRLIKTEEDYEKALYRIEGIIDAELGTPEMDELELLTALVEMYEDRHYPIGPPDPIEAIKFRMDQLGLTQKDMVPYIGTKSKVSEVLNGKRSLTLAMMRSLNKNLGISLNMALFRKCITIGEPATNTCVLAIGCLFTISSTASTTSPFSLSVR